MSLLYRKTLKTILIANNRMTLNIDIVKNSYVPDLLFSLNGNNLINVNLNRVLIIPHEEGVRTRLRTFGEMYIDNSNSSGIFVSLVVLLF